jgi:predicted AlkP superfamily phosphohydrolase/phosphomutase
MRSVVVGVDGLTFRILHPLIERGDLPHFQKLMSQGCESVLESKYPPLTPPAWTSLSTGLKPARHGVYDFWSYGEGGYRDASDTHVQTKRRGGKAIWNILSEFGKRVLVINVPVTYPPEAVNGIMVSGYMTPSSEVDFTYPATFKEELFRAVPDYQIDVGLRQFWGRPNGRDLLIDAILAMTQRRIALTTYLMKEKPWDFCYVAFVGPDRLQHTLWEDISSLDRRATEYFRLLDHGLGLIMEHLGPDDTLFVVSDHGFQGVTHVFNINEYLCSKGLLTPGASLQLGRARRTARLKRTLSQVGLLSIARKTKGYLKHTGALKVRHTDVYHPLLTDIEWERTLACVPSLSGYPGSYADIFLDGGMDAGRIAELAEDLKREVDPQSGKTLIDAVYTSEVFGQGPFAPREPHLLLLPNEGITFRMNLGSQWFWSQTSRVRGTHQKDGVLYAYGKDIRHGFKAPNSQIYDLVPTVLRAMDLPLPHTFDGRVLDELFVQQDQERLPVPVGNVRPESLTRQRLKKLLED